MPRPALTDAIQDYLREIYNLDSEGSRVSVTALAKRLGVSAASVSAMVKKLSALGLAHHEPYRGVRLTGQGEKVALEIIRHHRLLELYLAETLGLHVDDVHDEAERLEHAISEELEAKIDRALGFPTHDPHGDPIPDAELRWPAASPAERPVRDSGPVEGARGNREVPPTSTDGPVPMKKRGRRKTAPKASRARRARTA